MKPLWMLNDVCIHHPAGGNILLFVCLKRQFLGVQRFSFTTRCRSFALDIIVFRAMTKPFKPGVIRPNIHTGKLRLYIIGWYFTSFSSHWHARTNFRRKKNRCPGLDMDVTASANDRTKEQQLHLVETCQPRGVMIDGEVRRKRAWSCKGQGEAK